MPVVKLTSPATGKSYTAEGPIHETATGWCGTATDPDRGPCFVKLVRYGNALPQEQAQMRTWAVKEADALEKAGRCTDRVPRLYDHWDDRKTGTYVLVMQHLPGQTLEQWMTQRPLKNPDGKALFLRCLILQQIAEILAAIHRKIPGLNHRDIKPENVMIHRDEKGHWKVWLIDFGTAGQTFTIGGGTPGYQAPEQLSLEGVIPGTHAAKDVFSLGMVWHRLLSDIPATETRWQFVPDFDAPQWLERPTLPQWVLTQRSGEHYQRLFEKMTEFDPGKRPAFQQVAQGIQQGRPRK